MIKTLCLPFRKPLFAAETVDLKLPNNSYGNTKYISRFGTTLQQGSEFSIIGFCKDRYWPNLPSYTFDTGIQLQVKGNTKANKEGKWTCWIRPETLETIKFSEDKDEALGNIQTQEPFNRFKDIV